MKRFIVLSAVTLTALIFSSCDKIESALFKPFESPLSFEVTVPVITNTTSEVSMGQTNVQYNLDSVIRKNTGNVFGADIVGNMYIKEIGLELLDSDGSNNLSKFDYVKLSVSSGGSTPALFGPYNISAGSVTNTIFSVSNSPNIKPFFSGSAVTFNMTGKANTATTKTLRAKISATLRFEK